MKKLLVVMLAVLSSCPVFAQAKYGFVSVSYEQTLPYRGSGRRQSRDVQKVADTFAKMVTDTLMSRPMIVSVFYMDHQYVGDHYDSLRVRFRADLRETDIGLSETRLFLVGHVSVFYTSNMAGRFALRRSSKKLKKKLEAVKRSYGDNAIASHKMEISYSPYKSWIGALVETLIIVRRFPDKIE